VIDPNQERSHSEKVKPQFERPLREGGALRGLRYETPAFRVAYHFHAEAEIILIESGCGRRLVGDALEEFGPGDLVLVESNVPHSYHSHPDPSLRGGIGRAAVAQFYWEAILNWPAWKGELHRLTRLREASRTGVAFGPETLQQMMPAYERVIAGTGVRQLAALLEVLDILAHARDQRPIASELTLGPPDRSQVERFERVAAHVFAHFREPITLEEAARLAHMSPSAFSRFFKRTTRRSFVRFVNELRVGFAARLLLETDRTVAEIAFESGFRNLANFNRRFRELRGCAPMEFRRMSGAM